MGKFVDLTGKRFNRLLVIKKTTKNSDNRWLWECVCDCGKTCYRTRSSLIRKDTSVKSCGCYIYDFAKTRRIQNKIIKHDNYFEIVTNKGSIFVDNSDYDKVNNYHWRIHKNYATAIVWSDGKHKSIWMHKLITGPIEKGFDVDHINRNTLDNRNINLRVVKHYQNKQNVKLNENNTSGFRNISYNKKTGKYFVSFRYKTKQYSVGCFKTIEKSVEKLKNKRKQVMSEEDYKIYEDSLSI